MNSSMLMSSSRVHKVVGGEYLRPFELSLLKLLARSLLTLEYYLLMLSSLSFFSLATLASSSLLNITVPDVGAGTLLIFVFDDALDTLDTDDLVSSPPLSL